MAERDFGDRVAEAVALLDQYGWKSWHRERDRVQLAMLKLARGNVGDLRRQFEAADCDYRDVLSAAEYPAYTRKALRIALGKVPRDEVDEMIRSDWEQYARWLAGPQWRDVPRAAR